MKSETVTIRTTHELKNKFQELCLIHGLTMHGLFKRLLDKEPLPSTQPDIEPIYKTDEEYNQIRSTLQHKGHFPKSMTISVVTPEAKLPKNKKKLTYTMLHDGGTLGQLTFKICKDQDKDIINSLRPGKHFEVMSIKIQKNWFWVAVKSISQSGNNLVK